MTCLGLKDEKHFRESYQQVAVNTGLVEMTIPNKPQSRNQKYRLSAMGRAHAKQMNQGDN
jgi:ATP-dependent DNA helicase RecG